MKSIAVILFAFCSFTAFSTETVNLDKVECGANYFNLQKNKNGQPVSVKMKKDDQDFHVVFTGKIEKNEFRVVIEKSSNTVNGYINKDDGEMLSFRGGFHDGRVEFWASRGVMIPVYTIAISCFEE